MQSRTVQPAEVLKKYRVIAVVGASTNPEKEAHSVPLYLKENGYRVIPVNPKAETIFGEKAYHSLAEIPESVSKQVEVVEVFRPSEELPQVAAQVLDMKKQYGRPYVFWAQQGLENEEAKKMLMNGGVDYVMNACMRTIHTIWVRPRSR
jgi:uncharacterized protein